MMRIPPQPDRPPPMPFGVEQPLTAPPGLLALPDSRPAEFITDSGPARLPVAQPSEYHTVVPFSYQDAAVVEPPAAERKAITLGELNPRE
eukprot:4345309-Karenia_brevis.AAC.1